MSAYTRDRRHNAHKTFWKASLSGVGYQTDLYTASALSCGGSRGPTLRSNSSLVTRTSRRNFCSVIKSGRRRLWIRRSRARGPASSCRFYTATLSRSRSPLVSFPNTCRCLKPQYEKLYNEKKDAKSSCDFRSVLAGHPPGSRRPQLDKTRSKNHQQQDRRCSLQQPALARRRIQIKKHSHDGRSIPIIMTNGMVKPDSHLVIPIGPRKLFVAAPNLDLVNSLVGQNADEVVEFANDRIVKQAHRSLHQFRRNVSAIL